VSQELRGEDLERASISRAGAISNGRFSKITAHAGRDVGS